MLDLNRDDPVDRHDPPAWMRELVILRDRHCVFPWCDRDARGCDLTPPDHPDHTPACRPDRTPRPTSSPADPDAYVLTC